MRKPQLYFLAVLVAINCVGSSRAQQNWTTWKDYLGGPDSSHYSALKQINTGNVNKLDVAWSYPTGDDLTYTFSPLVIDNIAYFAAKQGSLVAVDATTGKELWVHPFTTPGDMPSRFGGIAGPARRELLGKQGSNGPPHPSSLMAASCMPSMRRPASSWTPSPITANSI